MNHTKIINLWPDVQTLAESIGQKYNTVMKWKYRESIPADKWVDLVKSAREHDLPVTFTMLSEGVKRK